MEPPKDGEGSFNRGGTRGSVGAISTSVAGCFNRSFSWAGKKGKGRMVVGGRVFGLCEFGHLLAEVSS